LTHHKIANLEMIIRVIAGSGIDVLVVEHHMDFVFRVSDRVTTLDLGKVIASGTPEEVQNDESVRRVPWALITQLLGSGRECRAAPADRRSKGRLWQGGGRAWRQPGGGCWRLRGCAYQLCHPNVLTMKTVEP
jgi:hypothetical protein